MLTLAWAQFLYTIGNGECHEQTSLHLGCKLDLKVLLVPRQIERVKIHCFKWTSPWFSWLCFAVWEGKQRELPANLLLHLISISICIHEFYSLSQASAGQSSASSRAAAKEWWTSPCMFDVPDPLVVHVLLLTHEFMYNVICHPHSWYPQCDSPSFLCAQHAQMIPPR